jgi:hypothetical protein
MGLDRGIFDGSDVFCDKEQFLTQKNRWNTSMALFELGLNPCHSQFLDREKHHSLIKNHKIYETCTAISGRGRLCSSELLG